MISTHAYGGDDEGGSRHALAERIGVRDLDRAVFVLDDGRYDLVHGGEPFAVGVDKRNLGEAEPFLEAKERIHENRDPRPSPTNDADFHRCLQSARTGTPWRIRQRFLV